MIGGCLKIKMELPKYVDCKNNRESCDFYMHNDCEGSCYFAQNIKKGITHTAKTGLERFIEKYGKNWRLIAFGEQSPIINNVPNEIGGEFLE